jgi:hypothetical protein
MSMGDQSDPAPTSAPVEKNPLWILDELWPKISVQLFFGWM